MMNPVASAIAFSALGALFAGTVFLLLLNPGSRSVRWWACFQVVQMAWLATQGWALAAGRWAELGGAVLTIVHLMPAAFVAAALVDVRGVSNRTALAVVLLGVLTAPLTLLHTASPAMPALVALWHVAVWSFGSVLMARRRRGSESVDRRLQRVVVGLILVVGPLALLGALTLGSRMWTYVMPLLVVWIQLLLFVGVARLRFYDIEVRARRSGETAAGVAEQERLALLGELTASLAHEIRNPLTGVRSLAQRLAEEEVDEPRRRRYASVILDEVERVERLVSNLLGVARRAPRAWGGASTRLDELFDDLTLLLSARAERQGVALRVDAAGLRAAAPREELAQVLLNLLLNAITHSPRGGTVELLAREGEGATEVLVRDQGPGVAPASRGRVWEPFYSESGGTGLGLAVVRRLAREHGWEVEVADAPDGGAEFRLRLPARRADEAEPVSGEAAAASPAIQRPRPGATHA